MCIIEDSTEDCVSGREGKKRLQSGSLQIACRNLADDMSEAT